jgi:hypothetical protein
VFGSLGPRTPKVITLGILCSSRQHFSRSDTSRVGPQLWRSDGLIAVTIQIETQLAFPENLAAKQSLASSMQSVTLPGNRILLQSRSDNLGFIGGIYHENFVGVRLPIRSKVDLFFNPIQKCAGLRLKNSLDLSLYRLSNANALYNKPT